MTQHFFSIMVFTAALALSGCTSSSQPITPQPTLSDCGASLLQDKVDEPVAGSSAADATVGGKLVRSKGDVRVIAPGQAVIQNYSEARLNLETDAAGNLVKASCG
jgi:starvation-inducible outer membrane lipoprotein